jgi:hypothetical protein
VAGAPRVAAVGDLDPDNAGPGDDRDRHRLTTSTRLAVPDAVAEKLAREQYGVIPARVPGAEHCARGRSAPAPPARSPSRSPGPPSPVISAPAFPGRPRPGKPCGTARGHKGMNARLSGAYRPLLPVEANAADQRLHVSRWRLDPLLSAICGTPEIHGRARTARVGAVTLTVRPASRPWPGPEGFALSLETRCCRVGRRGLPGPGGWCRLPGAAGA